MASSTDQDGILSSVWANKAPLFLPAGENDPRLTSLRETALRTESAMVAPLLYAGENLGVLALANGPMSTSFNETDFEVFKAIAEQSAFALYNAIVYSEVNEKKRLDRDLEIARDIQRILLPSTSPEVPGFEISGINIPARQVSGDYFDYIKVDDAHFGIVIADVSGKGVPASLIMAMCRSVLRSQATDERQPGGRAAQGQPAAFPRHEGGHVHFHGLPCPGAPIWADQHRAGGA